MARIRNLVYNGITVEQPVFNGVNLTKWIHDGVVVWEQGSAIVVVNVTMAQISAPSAWTDSDVIFEVCFDGERVYFFVVDTSVTPATTSCYSFVLGQTGTVEEWEDFTGYANAGEIIDTIVKITRGVSASGYSYSLLNPWDIGSATPFIPGGNSILSSVADCDYAIREWFEDNGYKYEIVDKMTLSSQGSVSNNVAQNIAQSSAVKSPDEIYSFLTRSQGGRRYATGVELYSRNQLLDTVDFDLSYLEYTYFDDALIGVTSYTYTPPGQVTPSTGWRLSKMDLATGISEHLIDFVYDYPFEQGEGFSGLELLTNERWYRDTDYNKQYLIYRLFYQVGTGYAWDILIIDKSYRFYRVRNVTVNDVAGDSIIISYNGSIYILHKEGNQKSIRKIEIPQEPINNG